MKGLLKKITLALLLGLTSLTAIQAEGGSNITVVRGNVVIIKFDNIQSEIAYVKLIDKDGVQLWSDVIKGSTNFVKQFNLAQLPDGDYDIIMKDGDVERIQGIRKSIDRVYVISTSVNSLVEPTVTLKDKNLKVVFPEGISKLESVSFQGAIGGEFFTDEVEYEEDFAKAYNLNKLPKGKYTVILRTNTQTVYKEVILK